MTKEEILAVAGYPNTPEGVAAFYNEYNTPKKFFKKHGGSLSGAPHDGQPTANQFFSYGSHVNDKLNIPMSNPFYLADGGTYYGGPIRPYAYGGLHMAQSGYNLTPEEAEYLKNYPLYENYQYNVSDDTHDLKFVIGPNNTISNFQKRNPKWKEEKTTKYVNIPLEGEDYEFAKKHLENDIKDKYQQSLVEKLNRDVTSYTPSDDFKQYINTLNERKKKGETLDGYDDIYHYMIDNTQGKPLSKHMLENYGGYHPGALAKYLQEKYFVDKKYGGYMDMGGNMASPTNYGAFNVPMEYGGNEEYGGVIDPSNNQDYPIMNDGGMGQYASGGDTSSLIKIIIAAGKARKKALGGDTVTQGGNSDNYPQSITENFKNALNQNIEKFKIEESLGKLNKMLKSNTSMPMAQTGFENWLKRNTKIDPNSPLWKKQAPLDFRTPVYTNTTTQDPNYTNYTNNSSYRFRVLDNSGRNYYDYNPNSYYKVNQQNMKKLNTLPQGYGLTSVEPSYGAGARLASNIVGLFGGKEKAAKTLGKFAPKKIKYNFGRVSDMQNTTASSTQPGTSAGPKTNLINGMPDYLLPGMYTPARNPNMPDYLLPGMYSPINKPASQPSISPNQQLQNQNELKPGTPEYDNRNSAEYNKTLFQNMLSISPYLSPFAYGGGLNTYQGGGNPGGNPVEMDEDISVTAKRKRDIDTQKLGMAIPRFMDIGSHLLEQSQINDPSKTSSAVDVKNINENKFLKKGTYEANLGILSPSDTSYATFYGSSPAAEGIATIKYGGNIYQDGGYTDETDPQQQLLQGVAQMLQQGAQPDDIAQQLNQMGIPQEQIMQIIQTVMQQLQGSQQMKKGGLVEDSNLDIFDVDQEYEITDDMKEELRRRGYEFEELD